MLICALILFCFISAIAIGLGVGLALMEKACKKDPVSCQSPEEKLLHQVLDMLSDLTTTLETPTQGAI